MEQIIGKLSEIETTAETIMRDALQKKKALSAEMERQSKEFDTQLEKQTEEQIKEIRRNLEGEKDKRLSSLREEMCIRDSKCRTKVNRNFIIFLNFFENFYDCYLVCWSLFRTRFHNVYSPPRVATFRQAND